ncbi:MAG TPA: DNA polymerase/3'-5' exonuclease PolX [Chthoniobacteraceae bacterium]|jgi:DNA polymerase (family 10)|nr:DNA polymerase/3'-5' exonuclease PolX [Chthoniobacteraceae bacterium]
MPQISKEQIADILESIAQMLELKGELVFKVRAYTNAARALEGFSGDLSKAVAEQQLNEIPGIGKAIAEKIGLLVTTGKLDYYENLRAEFPPGVFEMFELQGLGPKKIKAVWEKLGVITVGDLETASKDGRIAALAGFGKKTAENILAAIAARKKHSGRFRLGDIAEDAEYLLDDLRRLPEVNRVSVCGSYRRRKEIVGDLDFLVSTKSPKTVSDFFVAHGMVESVLAQGATKSSVRLKSGVQADLRVVKDEEYPFALNYFTGSKEHNIIMRQRALTRGWTLNEYRLAPLEKAEGAAPAAAVPTIREEADLYRTLGLDYVEPELREDRGEFIAAEMHTLPRLIEMENLRGTFHNHTTASDGRAPLSEMAAAARELGLQYLGIADHSKASFQAHGLDDTKLLAQLEEIRALNKTYDGEFKLFAGSEVDILRDGTLDFPDEILAQLDYAVASVHASFTMGQAEMTKRIIKAIANPYITMLGHLTGRLLLSREPYAVDISAVIDAAADTGTIIELNCNPMRLDMDWRWWPLAKAKGVKCAINPDAHHPSQFQYLWFGIGTARKGWLTRDDVVNCLPLGKIESVLAAKRP